MELTSQSFENNGSIPSKYTCDGKNINPKLIIVMVPKKTKSLVLTLDDPDIPKEVKTARGIEVFDHWVLFNIDPSTKEIAEDTAPGIQGVNSLGKNSYTGPCPPPQFKPKEHRYFFKLYALDIKLNLQNPTKADVVKAIAGHIIEKAELVGRYQRH